MEHRVYLLNRIKVERIEMDFGELSDETFIELAESEGTVYSLEGFAKDFNIQYIDSRIDVIRILKVLGHES